ncbi:hypothetical protein GIY30_09840 [Gordonia sp. HNM0687]|uniref:Uncharacterized protein n=1 Tax=Gordonia mangrovi TaxID=2665643 RepID=A0A6L7GQN1_9ACTN|nr:hypothetical protein [Gordonia mangrovi]MXP21647.1 hypothetical protein [Gordonia mangrovi]UVF80384.1 hypothetical protein NWF22_11435 [Gordonia mangrovi]
MDCFASLTGAVNRAELLTSGYADHEIRAAQRAGTLTALGSGVLIPTDLLDGTPEQRHRELALAWTRRSPGSPRALAGSSAAAVLGLPVWGLDTDRVTMVENGTKSRSRTTSVMHVVVDRRPVSTVTIDDVAVVAPARVVVDIARTAPRIPAIAVGDAALHAELCTVDDLANELDLVAGMTGAAQARRVIAALDGAAESVLESRSRMEMLDAGLPTPELQVDLYDAVGNWVARVDFYWRELGVVGESDGKSKYTGDDGQQRLLYEKGRSDAIVELGNRLIHWGWEDIEQREPWLARLRRMLSSEAAA